MRAALALARRGLGTVWPNPAVGCVIVKDGVVVGRGWTQPGGRPHAETEALHRAGDRARGACAYVTLEPCNHHGQTPPCTQALLDAGIARVVAALEDPDPRTAGGGFAYLRQSGVDVTTGVLADEACALNAGFLKRISDNRPLITLKTATSLDGRIAAKGGASQWITGPDSRARGHLLRASHDAIMVGIETVLADDPALTCRLAGLEDRSPVRIVVDSRLRLPVQSALVASAGSVPVWVVTANRDAPAAASLQAAGVEIIGVSADSDGRVDLRDMVRVLAERGLTRIVLEGGGTLAGAMLHADIIDRIVWFRAAGIIGGDGMPAVGPMEIVHPDQAKRFRRKSEFAIGADLMEVLEKPAETT